METIATQIQNKLINELISCQEIEVFSSPLTNEQINIYSRLQEFGGENVQNVKEVLLATTNKRSLEDINAFKQKLNKLQLDPRWKIITYGSLMKVLKEHNLVMGPLSNYIKEIPQLNAKMMIKYSETKRSDFFLGNYSTMFQFNENYWGSKNDKNLFFVCASIDNFKTNNRYQFGQELLYSTELKKPKFEFKAIEFNPDPIIVSPLIFECNNKKVLLVDVVTSWDREAGLIVNEIGN